MKLSHSWAPIGVGVLIAILLGWAASTWLRPLARLLPMTRSMVTITQGILVETRDLQTEFQTVQVNVNQLQRQDKLLEEQEELTRVLLAKLQLQGESSTEATALLIEILAEEQTALEISHQADAAGTASVQSALVNAQEVERLLTAAARINRASQGVDQELDQLLIELDGSAENLAIVARVKASARQAWESYTKGWEWLRGWFR